MFSLFNGRKQYYENRPRNNNNAYETLTDNDKTPAKSNRSRIIDEGIVFDNHIQVPISPFGNSYVPMDDDPAPSELSSSAYGEYDQQFPDTPSNEPSATTPVQLPPPTPPQPIDTKPPRMPVDPKQQQQSQSNNPLRRWSPKFPSHVTQAPEHGYTAGHEDDLSTLGDESIIRRGRLTKKQQLQYEYFASPEPAPQPKKKQKQKKQTKKAKEAAPKFDKTKIDPINTRSTEEISPSNASRDLSFSFSNVLDVNEKIPDSSRLGYDITDDSLTDRGKKRVEKKHEEEDMGCLQNNKWLIIKFMVGISLFLLMAAAAVLVVSLLHMRSLENQTQARFIDGDDYSSDETDVVDPSTVLPPLVPAEAPSEPIFPDAGLFVSTDSPTPVVTEARITSSPTPMPTEPEVIVTEKVTEAPTILGELPWADKITASPTMATKDPTSTPTASPTTKAPTSSPTLSPTGAPSSSPTSYPTSTPSMRPTFAPTLKEQNKVGTDLRFVIANFSPTSIPFLDDSTTAQAKAFDWMIRDPNYWTMEISTIVQRWTLAVLYYSTGGPDWQTELFPKTYKEGKSPWLSYSDECLWESSNMGTMGRICDSDNNLFAIHLRGIAMTGTLPAELSLLSNHMRLLFVNGNGLTGTLPPELGKLTLLEKINIQYNHMSGSLPSEVGQWSSLTIAAMGNNQFTGQIPPDTGNWSSMITIGFEKNSFSGTLPKEWANLPNLEKISLEHNNLTGTIPNEYSDMVQLTSLSLQQNDLDGEMPGGLCPGTNSVKDLLADCDQVLCDCCTWCS